MTTILTIAATASGALLVYEIQQLKIVKRKKIIGSSTFSQFWKNVWKENQVGNRLEFFLFLLAFSLAIFPFIIADFAKDKSVTELIPKATSQVFLSYATIYIGLLVKIFRRDFILFIPALIFPFIGVTQKLDFIRDFLY